jgi:spore coat polysaccharide biosynthesis protein SpsF
MTRVGIITQARTTSTRLPNKVLMEIGGRRVLDHHIDRLLPSGFPVFVATTTNEADDPIADLADARGVGVHRGSESDVLARFAGCASEAGLEAVVRVTSDCPLIDPGVLTTVVARYLSDPGPRVYVSNVLERSFPRGFDVEVFSAEALAQANKQATSATQREHVTPYLYQRPEGEVELRHVLWPQDKSSYRVTLDTEQDLALITALIVEHGAARLDCAAIIDVLDHHPELVAINADIVQKGVEE